MTSVYVFIFHRLVFLRSTQLLGSLVYTVVFPGTLISEFVVGFLVKLVKFNLSLTPSSFGRGTGGQSLSHRTSHIVLVLVPILDHEWTGR